MEKYISKNIELKWQKYWEESNYGVAKDFDNNPKHYHLVEFPYPSGAGLHVGHCMGYGASDAYCRMKRMQGFNVMYPIGWDAFGLPTENYALRTGVHPTVATKQNVEIFKKQIKRLGYAFDWSREVNTTDPEYYKWTQWIFLQFYRHGIIDGKLVEITDDDTTTLRLAYQKEMPINWCPSCKIGLANEEVINGSCERCGTVTEKRMQKQWLLRITAYADRLIDDLNTVDYLDKIKTQQINWIGRSEGAEIDFRITNYELRIKVFTTRPDTLFGATYMVVAPEHKIIDEIKDNITNYEEVLQYIQDAKKKSDLERTELQKDKTGVEIKGIKAVNPVNNEEIPIFVADYVLVSYGTGAIMAVPAHDERDFEFAKKYNLPIRTVVVNSRSVILSQSEESGDDKSKGFFAGEDGVLINSDFLNDLKTAEAKQKMTEWLEKQGAGCKTTNYKLRDWIFSRQHYWGEPIPIIHCEKCGMVPMDEKDLPLELPQVERYEPTNTGESPLARIDEWVNTTCPKCEGPAKRETDTMPNWAGSSWYFLAYAARQPFDFAQDRQDSPSTSLRTGKTASQQENNHNKKAVQLSGCPADMPKFTNIFQEKKDELSYWLPVDIYNGGMEHTTLHLLYSRFWHKFLFDLGVVPTSEPYAKRIAHGIILGPDGQKMSKSRGNVINPDDMVVKFGADTLRAYIMFIGPYDQESAWNTAGIQGVHRFMTRVWNNQAKVSDKPDNKELLVKLHQTIAGVTDDLENFRLNTVISKLMEFNNTLEKIGHISKESYLKFLQLLFPAAPHLASELWESSGTDGDIWESKWPEAKAEYLVPEEIEAVIQIDGKVRDRLRVPAGVTNEELEKLALASGRTKEFVRGKSIAKIVVVPGKLVSIATGD